MNDMKDIYRQFMDGVQPPKRGKLFRLRYWLYARIFVIGEWAGRHISQSKELTPLEQLYMACECAGCSPDYLRTKLQLANSALLEKMAKQAAEHATVRQ